MRMFIRLDLLQRMYFTKFHIGRPFLKKCNFYGLFVSKEKFVSNNCHIC